MESQKKYQKENNDLKISLQKLNLRNKILETESEEQNNNILNLMKDNQILEKFKN